ncbi:enoyl-CoA hydratase [Lutibaculum baratangense]|uniref:Enoyl-CoA hydratase n=1 Tax=Lutibaculum baratangense AMV1 TaxID=631454 RepID=V4RB17_9HYPH|nr:enoyl-CoA hydratase [Lutibaculum baratangense]ESR22594.1 Enoyl-CoA hydratase [Lutibaculum baratangense AMV1]
MTEPILLDVDGDVATLTFNRPEARNALTFEMYEGLRETCERLAAEGTVRCLVITGAGGEAFAAGTDISQFRSFRTAEDAIAYEERIEGVLRAIELCPMPVVAAIAGACTGGGAAIASACDIRIATAGSRFGFPIARTLGNCLSTATISRVAELIGPGRTKELIFTARLIPAEEARAVGFVSEVVPDDAALQARARELAALMTGHAPITLSATKEALRRLRTGDGDATGSDLVVRAYTSEDFREGMEAFLAKRPPQWKGR